MTTHLWPSRRPRDVPMTTVPTPETRLPRAPRVGLYDPALRARRLWGRAGGRPRRGRPPTRWCARPSRPSSTWPTGAPPAARRTPATGPASSSRSPTASTPASSTSTSRPAGPTPPGWSSCPRDDDEAAKPPATRIDKLAGEEGLRVIGWRDVPIHDGTLGSIAEAAMPSIHQLFVAPTSGTASPAPIRPWPSTGWPSCCASGSSTRSTTCYLPSLSARTIVYKGMLTSHQLAEFFPDLSDERVDQRAGPGPLPLLHQHLPLVAAGPPLPLPGPQRRDQHAGRQPQLDAGPGGPARHAT